MKQMLSKQKMAALQDELMQETKIVVVQGPPGCGKTTAIKQVAEAMQRKIEYIQNIKKFAKCMSKKTIALVDIDDKKAIKDIVKNKNANQIVIETRCTLSMKELMSYADNDANDAADTKIQQMTSIASDSCYDELFNDDKQQKR